MKGPCEISLISLVLQHAVNRGLIVLFSGDIKGAFNGGIDFCKAALLGKRDKKKKQQIC